MVLAAFDFDGTLIRRDSMLAFIRYVKGDFRFFWGMCRLSPWLLAFKLKWISRQSAKEKLLFHFFEGMSESLLKQKAQDFAEEKLEEWVRPPGMERLAWHQQQGHRCVLVTASLDLWTAPWARQHGLELIATQAGFDSGIYQKSFQSPNCYGAEKVNRMVQLLEGERVEHSYAYGDSSGDREMLAWADEGAFRPFV